MQRYVAERRSPGTHSLLLRYLIVDTASRETRPLIDAPLAPVGPGIAWSLDSKTVVVSGTFLPLDTKDPRECARSGRLLLSWSKSVSQTEHRW